LAISYAKKLKLISTRATRAWCASN
jgi:hypothetical protein